MHQGDWLSLLLFFLLSPRCQPLSRSFTLSSPPYLAPWLVLSLCWWEHKPQCFFLFILFFDDVLRIHLAGYRAVFLGLKAARMCPKTRLRCTPLVKQVLSASNRLSFLFSYLMQSSFYASQDSGYWYLAPMRLSGGFSSQKHLFILLFSW